MITMSGQWWCDVDRLLDRYTKWLTAHFFKVALTAYLLPYAYYLWVFVDRGDATFLDWKITQYAVNYFEHGFIKRGFVGTLFSALPPDFVGMWVVAVNTVLFAVFLLLSHRLITTLVPENSRNVLLALVAISPFCAFQFAFDVGRFDIYNLLLMVAALGLLLRGRIYPVLLLVSIATLIHEGFVVYGVPLIVGLAIYLAQHRQGKALPSAIADRKALLLSAVVAVLSVVIYLFGNNVQLADSVVGYGGVVWKRGLFEISFGGRLLDKLILGAMVLTLYGLLTRFYQVNRGRFDVLYVMSFAPLALFVMGVDYARWCALIFMNILVVILLKIVLEKWHFSDPWLVRGSAPFLIPLGPSGITSFFPIAKDVSTFLRSTL